MPAASDTMTDKLLVQIASYNTNLQGNAGLPQDLVNWLAPTLTVSSFLSHDKQAPDIVAVGFQELLPLHFGLAGLSKQVIQSRDELIRSQIEQHVPSKDNYSLVARIVNVGIALLVYVRDEEVGQRVRDVQTQWTGCGPGWMGNKGAVGVRFRLAGVDENDVGEDFTFVCAHLTAHAGNVQHRIADYRHIVSTLLFDSTPPLRSTAKSTIYDTSHLFFFGDLNFRLSLPSSSPLAGLSNRQALLAALNDDRERELLRNSDELFQVRASEDAFIGLHEGDFWRFKCTYKYKLNEVDHYNPKRTPAWTDRILYASYLDPQEDPSQNAIQNILYTSIPSYTTSDHKPIVALLLVPTRVFSSQASSSTTHSLPPSIKVTPSTMVPRPDSRYVLKRYTGRLLDRLIGSIWTLFWLLGLGNAAGGVFNFFFTIAAWRWMTGKWSMQGNVGPGAEES